MLRLGAIGIDSSHLPEFNERISAEPVENVAVMEAGNRSTKRDGASVDVEPVE